MKPGDNDHPLPDFPWVWDAYADFKSTVLPCLQPGVGGVAPVKDVEFRKRLLRGLAILHVKGVAVRMASHGQWLWVAAIGHERKVDEVVRGLTDDMSVDEQWDGVIRKTVTVSKGEASVILVKPDAVADTDVVAIIDERASLYGGAGNPTYNTVWFPTAQTVREVFRRRDMIYRHFPPDLSCHYWRSVAGLFPKENRLAPPWKCEGSAQDDGTRTVTLSLDLRRSTFCMEQSDDNSRFAGWMNGLIRCLTAISSKHNAVFDKFTGDGVIVHFLCDDIRQLTGDDPIERAVRCALEMIMAVRGRLPALREFLQNDSLAIGAGVGIAMGNAHWGIDDAGNPLVVGRGVVGACRTGDKAPSGTILMANSDYRMLVKRFPVPAEQYGFVTKEFNAEMKVMVWKLNADDLLPLLFGNMCPGGGGAEPA